MRIDPTLVRSGQWWNHKIPPVIAVAVFTVLPATDINGIALVMTLCVFLIATIGIAAFGHVVNDLADIRTDGLAGKVNQMSKLQPSEQKVVLIATVAAGLMPWVWLPHSPLVLALIATEVTLLVVYSVPPIRLKDRSTAGVVADALYAYVIPFLLTIAVFTRAVDTSRPPVSILVAVALWGAFMGIRGILWHQIGDLAYDRRAGVHTLATRLGAVQGRRLLGSLVVAEFVVAMSTLTLVAASSEKWWLVAFCAVYVLYRLFQMSVLWTEPIRLRALRDPGTRVRFVGFVLLNEFVEKWLPPVALVALAVSEPVFWPVVLLYLIVFENAFVEFLRSDLPALPDALNRLAHERKARHQIRRVASIRKSEIGLGPQPLSDHERKQRRWVFVVCGPELHIDTLRTAVSHLRPLTGLEIWVLTDSSRNVHPLDQTGIDRIVDVRAPEGFDDHQASIWMKTSVHRHLPPGEWCYLDTDIIAVRPGMEEVFEHRSGPVAFASDLTISVNQVDRFSPWAMNCDCTGHGEVHSCSHLREQLKTRLNVDVPGDWVHWNGGVFVFGNDSSEFLDLWHQIAVDSFGWPEWRTRDQGALIATAWTLGQQDCQRLPAEFNFIADLGNGDLCLDPDKGWALHPSGPWRIAKFLHLYTSRLEDPSWDLGRDVEAPVVRQTLVRSYRWRRSQVRQHVSNAVGDHVERVGQKRRDAYWTIKDFLALMLIRSRRTVRRLQPHRIKAGVKRRREASAMTARTEQRVGADTSEDKRSERSSEVTVGDV